MAQSNTIGVDLAKNVIQVSVVSSRGKEISNKALSRQKFSEFLAKQNPSLVAFEACASAHHWARLAREAGHTVRILPALSVAPYRQGHKTDKNDALAVAEAAVRPNIKEAPLRISGVRSYFIRESTPKSQTLRIFFLSCSVYEVAELT